MLDSWIQKYKSYVIRASKKAYKCSLKYLAVGPEPGPLSDLNNEGRAVYISAPGDLSLACISWNFVLLSGHICMLSSRLETADEFRSWVFEEILPAIRGAGKLEASLRQELVLKARAVDE